MLLWSCARQSLVVLGQLVAVCGVQAAHLKLCQVTSAGVLANHRHLWKQEVSNHCLPQITTGYHHSAPIAAPIPKPRDWAHTSSHLPPTPLLSQRSCYTSITPPSPGITVDIFSPLPHSQGSRYTSSRPSWPREHVTHLPNPFLAQ